MSGPPKRSHDESSHAAFTMKRPLEDATAFSNPSGKSTQSVINDYHPPFEPGLDGRLSKGSRSESRDGDKRYGVGVLPLYRVSSSNDPGLETSMDARPDPRELKDNRDSRTEVREAKVDARELYGDSRLDSQLLKADKDTRLENRGDDKDLKSERENITNFKYESKMEKDVYVGGTTHLSWKDPKDHHRKRYQDPSFDSYEPWRVSRSMLHGSDEITKSNIPSEDKEYFETREAVGENKVEWKSEEKIRDKERKRKDEKSRDWIEREKDKSDRRKDPQHAISNNERRESARIERELDRSEKENMDGGKDKERLKDREKDHTKREMPEANEKECVQGDKEHMEVTAKGSEPETTAFEPKRTKEFDAWKVGERDSKDRKWERDQDNEGDRPEKRGRSYEKDAEDGFAGDGSTEREREGFSYGVQQRRRMLRPRGTLQSASRESRRARQRDNERSQGKPELSTVVYKVGECMQELVKLWKEFEGSQSGKNEVSQNGKNDEGAHSEGPTLEIRIPTEYVTATNRQVRGGQLWGTDVYTDDSDLVAVLMHTGYCRPTASSPPSAIQEFRAHIRVLPPQECYISTLRNNVRSRAWGAATGCSYRVDRCCILKKGGGSIDLEPCLTHTSAVEPTLAPVSTERTITTRSAASNAFRLQRLVREVTIQYNLCNEPWVKYSLGTVADKGLKKPLFTSARLKKGEVLYVETHSNRYELCYNGEKPVGSVGINCNAQEKGSVEPEKLTNGLNHAQNGDRHLARICNGGEREPLVDVFRWSRCKQPLPQKVMRSFSIPLPIEHLEVLEENLDWEDVQWSQTGVWIAGKEYVLARVHFLSPN
ncbi:unnamed protein product [Victoria cruziana]